VIVVGELLPAGLLEPPPPQDASADVIAAIVMILYGLKNNWRSFILIFGYAG